MNVTWVEREQARAIIANQVIKTEVVLDVGPGIMPQTYFHPHVHICVEPHLPYIDRLKEEVKGDPSYLFLNCTWDVAFRLFPSKSVDSIFALDFIEHLKKNEGFDFLKEAERIARKQVLIYTPLGFYPQSYEDKEKPDRWGMDGGFWQTHRSGWGIDDFGDNWDLVCCQEFHLIDQNAQPLDKPFGALWAFLNLPFSADRLSQPSDSAFHTTSTIKRLVSKISHLLHSPYSGA